ncbi:MAG TPA: zf-HC2 domain-containing protein [Candidatus Acidoferrales bacterium]|nr:zf-HC2 domain-containing protein [Candidatus Acidoferrales bacterium]
MSEHEKIRARLAALTAGTLSVAEAAEAKAHLAACASCASEFARWQRLERAVTQLPAAEPSTVSVSRIAALATARRWQVLERRWNRLVLTGLILYGWALFLVIWPLLPTVTEWLSQQLRLPWFAVVGLALLLWWSFCWVIGLGLLPLLRDERPELEEKVT